MSNGITILGISIHFYGIIIMLGAIAAAVLSARQAKKHGQDPDAIWDMLPWLLVAGIIGARLWHVFTPPASSLINGQNPYFIHPLDALMIWRGGLGIPGAVMGGALALYIYARVKKMSFATWVDIIAPGLALAQAIGRWGNFVNQEVYGLPTSLPWKIYIDPAHRLPGYENVAYYHPTFFYEFLWNLLNMGVLLWLYNKHSDRLKPGDVFLTYLIIYPIGRFMLEFIRIDYSPVFGININQWLMAALAVGSAIALIVRHRKGAKPTQPETPEAPSASE